MTDVTGRELVAAVWPVDGPHCVESIRSAAETIAELTRYLAHAGRSFPSVLSEPADAYSVFGELTRACSGLDQATRSLAGWAEDLAGDPRLREDGTDSNARGVELAYTAAEDLRAAARALHVAGSEFGRAHSDIATLCLSDEGADR